ncbi:MAG: twitching motility protein PilT [Anaerolineae bacterium]|nr:PIN domain-containing protein [Anaerolineales bacterium]MCK6625269.1 PIN domain-containing protein [Anaerolineae bacterium]MCQ3979667.1 twitching motility protein PilT [Anaerolineae bacterium]
MANKYVLDTHALIWYLEGNRNLGRQAKAAMEATDSEMVLPLIALAEATYLIEKGRVGIPTVSDLLTDVSNDDRIEVHQLTWEVFERSLTPEGLQIPELHDRFIVSTGLHLQDLGHTVAILTKDKSITDARVLPVIW